MNAKGWVASLIVVGGVGMGIRSGCSVTKAPDEKLASHLDDLCKIARANIDTPEKGIKKYGRYLVGNLEGITGSLGGTISAIERITDDEKHDDRARLARDRLNRTTRECADDLDAFFDAVEADPEALAIVNEAMERFSRTIEILLGPGVSVRGLPARLEALLPAPRRAR